MEVSNVKTTPGGNHISENPPAAKAAEAGILGATTSISKKPEENDLLDDYKAAKKDLENAKFILKRAEQASEKGENSANHEKNIKWAKDTISRLTQEKMNNLREMSLAEKRNILKSEASAKRNRSGGSGVEFTNKPKKSVQTTVSTAKILDNIPYCEIVKMNLRVCIVDTNDPEWKIKFENFKIIERFVIKEIRKFVKENPGTNGPIFKMNERLRGHYKRGNKF